MGHWKYSPIRNRTNQEQKTNEKKEEKKLRKKDDKSEEPNICEGERVKGGQGQPNELRTKGNYHAVFPSLSSVCMSKSPD